MTIRVLHVVTYMGRGGLETMLMNYYRNIDRNKVQFDFLTHRYFEAEYDREIQRLGGKIYHLPKLNPFDPKYLSALDNFYKRHLEYKIVHSHLDCMAGIPLKYAKKNGIPVRIAHAHNNNQVKDKKYFLKLLFKKNITKYATDLFACSEEAGDWMFNGKQFSVLNNAIDAHQYIFNDKTRKKLRVKMGIPSDTLVLGHVGRFSPQKNHNFLIDVFNSVKRRKKDCKLLLIGIGELQEVIQKKVRNLNLSNDVIFAGLRDDVPELLQTMDIFIFPSIFEGLGIANIEAQAASLPCIISDAVPKECIKTKGLVKQLTLKEGADMWADEILKINCSNRRNTYREIVEAGFDIKSNALKLEKYYSKKWRKDAKI